MFKLIQFILRLLLNDNIINIKKSKWLNNNNTQ